MSMVPLVSGLSEYGSSSAAPQEPRAPSVVDSLVSFSGEF